MILMALDHVRWLTSSVQFDPTDLAQTNTALFFTRWVTHFCAPAFLFLAGMGVFLHGSKPHRRESLSRFLLLRGFWLVIIEMTVVRLGWTANFAYNEYLFGGVIWMIGLCLIGFSLLVRLRPVVIGMVGLVIIAGHNLSDIIAPGFSGGMGQVREGLLWPILYTAGNVTLGRGGPVLAVLFPVIPWIGVMAGGYAFAHLMQRAGDRRDRWAYRIGLGAVGLFLLLRLPNLYGDPHPWTSQPRWWFTGLSILNATKYPASLVYLLMTLGPMIALMPILDRARGRLWDMVEIYGRAPFWFYVLHLPVAHLAATVVSLVTMGRVIPWLSGNQPMLVPWVPDGYGLRLPGVYFVFVVVVVVLYLPCRWMANLKRRRRDWWLSFL